LLLRWSADAKSRNDARRLAGAVSVAPVENLAFIKNNRVLQSVRPDVGNECIELRALHQREEVRERMKLDSVGGCVIWRGEKPSSFVSTSALAFGRRNRRRGRTVCAHAALSPPCSFGSELRNARRSSAVTMVRRPIFLATSLRARMLA